MSDHPATPVVAVLGSRPVAPLGVEIAQCERCGADVAIAVLVAVDDARDVTHVLADAGERYEVDAYPPSLTRLHCCPP